jgi:uncharacterized protein (TIGR03067 family)
MKAILCLGLILAGSLPAIAADAPDDVQSLQGLWLPASAELSGQPMSQDLLKVISLRLDNGRYEVFVAGEPDRGTYAVSAGSNPKSMLVIGTVGPNHGRCFPAIYDLEGDTLRICYDLSGAAYPTDFKSAAGTKLYLVTYNRKRE